MLLAIGLFAGLAFAVSASIDMIRPAHDVPVSDVALCGTGDLMITNVACRLLDVATCRCRHYDQRLRYVPDCVHLTADKIHEFHWLPPTCAYRLLAEGQDLPDWHPLITGTADTVHSAGISVQSWAISEREAGPLEDHVVAVVSGR